MCYKLIYKIKISPSLQNNNLKSWTTSQFSLYWRMLQEFVIARDMQNIHKNIEVAFLYLL